MNEVIDLAWLPYEAYLSLHKYDESKIGTREYLGIAFYWNSSYAHLLIRATPKQRKCVHDQWLKENLSLGSYSDRHEEIIKEALEERVPRLRRSGKR